MVLVIVGSLVISCLLLFQGVHVFRKGNMRPFFEQPSDLSDSQPSLSLGNKLAGASLYTIPSVAILCLLMFAMFKNDMHRLMDWGAGHIFGLIGGLFLVVYGLLALLRPDVVLRWLRSTYISANIQERDASSQLFVRALGAFVFGLGLLALKSA